MRIYLTAKDTTNRLTETSAGGAQGKTAAKIKVDLNAKRQTILGFGGAFTEAAAYTFSRMSAEKQEQILNLYFSGEGSRYNLGRMSIASNDFSLELYDYVQPGDEELKTFDMSREEKWVIPMIRRAIKTRGAGISMLATPWSPPPFMKDNNDKKHGGHLLPKYYKSWANHFVKFLEGMKGYGIPIEWLSVQNEPDALQTWDSCLYTPEEERGFVRGHLGPALRESGFGDIKILVHDHNRDILLKRVLPIYADAKAAEYIWGAAVHWYVSEEFENVGKLHEAYPEKHLLHTEACQEGGLHLGAWHTGERYARNIIGDISNFMEGWIEWNLVVDETGGPNHVSNFCDAAIVCDTRTDEVIINSSYYYIAHFSRYIQPGAVRVESSCDNSKLQTLAAQNPDGSVTLVAVNPTDKEQPFTAEMGSETVSFALPAHGIVTVVA